MKVSASSAGYMAPGRPTTRTLGVRPELARSRPLERDEGVGQAVGRDVRLTGGLAPGHVETRRPGVAFVVAPDLGHEGALRERLGLGIDLCAADHPDLGQLLVFAADQGLAQAAGTLRAVALPIRLARDHNV